MVKLIFTVVFVAVAAAILFAAVSPWLPTQWLDKIKPAKVLVAKVWGWVQRNLTTVAVGAAALVALFYGSKAGLYRRRQAKHVEKAREAKVDNLEKAAVERDKAVAAAGKASEAVKKGQTIIEELANEPKIANSARVDRINQRLRNAARTRK